VSLKIILACHVEPGTIRKGILHYDFDRPEGIVKTLPTILEFADNRHARIGFAFTVQAAQLSDVDLGGHEAGVHLHPLDPALSKLLGDALHPDHDCLGMYPSSDQALLISAARRAHEDILGRSARWFIAGRWSENASTVRLLQEEGFTHDGSAIPGHRTPCSDWSRLARLAQPYNPQAGDHQRRGSEPLVYIPVYQGLWGHYLTPETICDLGMSYYRAALKEAQVGSADVVHIYFHSPMALNHEAMVAFGAFLDYAQDAYHAEFVLPTDLTPSLRPRSRPFPPAYWAALDWTLLKSLGGRGGLGRRIAGMASGVPEWDGISAGGMDRQRVS